MRFYKQIDHNANFHLTHPHTTQPHFSVFITRKRRLLDINIQRLTFPAKPPRSKTYFWVPNNMWPCMFTCLLLLEMMSKKKKIVFLKHSASCLFSLSQRRRLSCVLHAEYVAFKNVIQLPSLCCLSSDWGWWKLDFSVWNVYRFFLGTSDVTSEK